MNNNTQTIFLDFDGTVVSYHDRFYKIYSEAYTSIGEIPLSRSEWIISRRNGIHHYPPGIHERIDPYFAEHFESSENLKLDKIFPHMKYVIETLQKKYPVKIVSFRSNLTTLKEQLRILGIHNVELIIQGFSAGTICDEKANMIKRIYPNPSGFIIGDTEYEIQAGKTLGLKTIAVDYGDRTTEFLEQHNPDYIISDPREILEILNLT